MTSVRKWPALTYNRLCLTPKSVLFLLHHFICNIYTARFKLWWEVYDSEFSAYGSGLTPICDMYRKGNLESESNFPGVFFIAWKDLLRTPF